jgi:sulfate adenylyltransferase subunit 1 (EFTu-like GTPase family)
VPPRAAPRHQARYPGRLCAGQGHSVRPRGHHSAPQETKELGLNEIGRVQLCTTVPLLCDPYSKNRTTGSFILIDAATGVTVGAGIITRAS